MWNQVILNIMQGRCCCAVPNVTLYNSAAVVSKSRYSSRRRGHHQPAGPCIKVQKERETQTGCSKTQATHTNSKRSFERKKILHIHTAKRQAHHAYNPQILGARIRQRRYTIRQTSLLIGGSGITYRVLHVRHKTEPGSDGDLTGIRRCDCSV